jgi:hypothetical protein
MRTPSSASAEIPRTQRHRAKDQQQRELTEFRVRRAGGDGERLQQMEIARGFYLNSRGMDGTTQTTDSTYTDNPYTNSTREPVEQHIVAYIYLIE